MRRKKKVVRSRCDNNRRFLQDDVLWYGNQHHFPRLAVGWNPLPAATVGFVFIGFGAPIQPKMLLSMVGIEIDLVYKGKIVKISNLKLFLFEFFR